MEPVSVKHSGKGWNGRSVASMSKDDFVKDPAHAIEGLSADDNATALAAVYATCVDAVKAADAPPADAPDAKKAKK